MAINPDKLINRVKTELRIYGNADDARIKLLVDEAFFSLQNFVKKTITDGTVTDTCTQVALNPLHVRYIVIYVAIQYDGDASLDPALSGVLEQVRG